jgi:hypothetical protein
MGPTSYFCVKETEGYEIGVAAKFHKNGQLRLKVKLYTELAWRSYKPIFL